MRWVVQSLGRRRVVSGAQDVGRGGRRGRRRRRHRADDMLVLCLQTLMGRGGVSGVVVREGAGRRRRGWRQVVAGGLRMEVGAGGCGAHPVGRSMLRVRALRLHEVGSSGGHRRRGWRRGHPHHGALVMDARRLRGQEVPAVDQVARHGRLLAGGAGEGLVWSGGKEGLLGREAAFDRIVTLEVS